MAMMVERVVQREPSGVHREQVTQEEWFHLDAWREQVDSALRRSGVKNHDELDSLFDYYGESIRAAERGVRSG